MESESSISENSSSAFLWNGKVKVILLLIAVGAVGLLVLFTAVYLLHQSSHSAWQVLGCSTEDCNTYAKTILTAVDAKFRPCDNFYNYVCREWKGNLSGTVQQQIVKQTKRRVFLEAMTQTIPSFNQTAAQKAARLLQTCFNVMQVGQTSVEPLKEYMASIGILWPKPASDSWVALLVDVSLNWDLPVWGLFRTDYFNRDTKGRPILTYSRSSDVEYWIERWRQMEEANQFDQFVTSHLMAFGAQERELRVAWEDI